MRAGCSIAVVLMVGLANAQTKVVKLVYTRHAGAGGCPTAAETEGAVAARLGYNPFRADGKEAIAVRIAANKSGGLSAVMRLLDAAGVEQGTRDLSSTSRDCSELASSLQLAIAIAVDPQAFMGGPVAPVAQAEPMPPPPPPPPLVEATAEPAASDLRFSAGLGVVGLIGSAPDVTGGLDLRLTLSARRFSLSFDGRFDLPRGLDVGPGRTSVSTVIGTLAPCFQAHRGIEWVI